MQYRNAFLDGCRLLKSEDVIIKETVCLHVSAHHSCWIQSYRSYQDYGSSELCMFTIYTVLYLSVPSIYIHALLQCAETTLVTTEHCCPQGNKIN